MYSRDGLEQRTFRPGPRAVNAVAFAPGGDALAAADVHGTVSVWDLASGRQTVRFPGPDRAADCLEFAPDGMTLVASSSLLSYPLVCEPGTGRARPVAAGLSNLNGAIAFAPDGRTLAMAGGDGSVLLWGLDSRQVRAVLPGRHSMIWALAFTPDGRWLASGGDDLTIRLWHVPETAVGEPSTPFSSPPRTGGR